MVTQQAGRARGLIAEDVRFPGHHGELIEAYSARPLGDGPFPGVLVIFEAFGMVDHTRELVRKFAAAGYVAVAPDLYTRIDGVDPNNFDTVRPAMMGLPDVQAIGDMEAAIAYLKAMPQSNGKVGSIGHCSGGRHSFLIACNSTNLDAAVDCYGGFVVTDDTSDARPTPVIDMVADLGCPLLGLFGETDGNPSPEHVARIEEELTKYGKEHELHSYAAPVGHGFFADYRPSYSQEAAVDGWGRIFAFFEKHLR